MPYSDPKKASEYRKKYYKRGPGGYFWKRNEKDPQRARNDTLKWKLKKFGMTLDDYLGDAQSPGRSLRDLRSVRDVPASQSIRAVWEAHVHDGR